MRKETLLRLLLLGDGLETAGDWGTAVEDGEVSEGGVDTTDQGGEGEGAHTPLVVAIEEIVPYLPDYSAVSSKLKGLLGYADKAYPGQVDRLVQGWLQRTPAYGVSFRRWVLRDWLKCSHLTSADPSALVQWRYALFVASTNETVTMLKRTLQEYIDAVDAVLEEDPFDGESDGTSTLLHSIETVEDLLDFCWMHAEQLASCSLLCAAKLHALAVRTQRSASKLAEDEEVLVRLRWSLMLKPLLFKPLLQHAIALKVLPGRMVASQTWASNELTDAVAFVDLARRERALAELKASREELERAFASGVKHVHVSASNTKDVSLAEASIATYVESISADKRKLLLTELERDLDDAPSHLFPHVFALFGLVVSGLLSSADGSELLVSAVDTLFALFGRRIHDPASCLDALGLVLRLLLARHPLWHDNTPFYLKTVETLSETATLQVEPKVKWAARMALQQLLFECDVQLLHISQTNLRHLLPPSTMRFVSMRLGS
ncbi:hypothetical protein PF005_g17147 [Phytophthora fragariae]|uniref:Uncharacterized protein n=1 Tax=Phytophthora fragariae TaxID=53985 RepID=A0A6A3RFY6_9STRA|nr:hypothetical protein PF003_g30588 [Phytophthora fragariae]KAE8931612.1 hypothetical protein PF009_g18331 [Phytophthora fragariae]KAE8996100.1 hypothetical protein PF011_g16046 [Phytophthora fragariae]KAE9095454.1 hypothetical protein PF010_g16698 [Phytophthora fragariae]KAE9095689.1 hypothetical protein PF007_g17283 [Phytophthora fragariae]